MRKLDKSQLRTYLFTIESESGEFDVPVTVIDYMATKTTVLCNDPVSVESQVFRALRQLYRELMEEANGKTNQYGYLR